MSIIQGPAMQGSSRGFYPTTIDQSARISKADSASIKMPYTSKGTATDLLKFTFSGWVKRGAVDDSTFHPIISAGTTATNDTIVFSNLDKIQYVLRTGGSVRSSVQTDAVFRDPSAWYHVVVVYDAANATSADRCKIYVNGVQQDTTVSDAIETTRETRFTNNASTDDVYMGYGFRAGTAYYSDMYRAEFHMVDGQLLDPTYFGEEKSGIWVPKTYEGTYGNNGFYIDFSNTTVSAGSITSVNDSSPNGLDFNTVTNVEVSDIVPDSPSNNFAVLNYADYEDQGGDITEGGLYIDDVASSANSYSRGTIGVTSGKWYYEVYFVNAVNGGHIGWAPSEFSFTSVNPFSAVGQTPSVIHTSHTTTNIRRTDDVAPYSNSLVPGGPYSQGAGVVLGVAYDADAGEIKYWLNGVAMDSGNVIVSVGNPELGWMPFVGVIGGGSTQDYAVNFGQDSTFQGQKSVGGNSDANGIGDFAYAPPSGFLALCTSNLPDPAIDPAQDATPEDHFNVVLWTGDTNDDRSITGVGFQPDLVWIKSRSTTWGHWLYDVVRGTGNTLQSESTNFESVNYTYGYLDAFETDGFGLQAGATSDDAVNANTHTYVAWNWKAGGTGVSNTDGSITSTVSANTDAGFSIVGYTGTGSAATVGHGLSSAPMMVICKSRTNADGWSVYHKGVASDAETDYLWLNLTDAAVDNSAFWNDTAPTSSVFSVGTHVSANRSGANIIAYCFHSVEGFSKFGSYTGNGSTDGPFVYTGFRPAFVMVKVSSAAGERWQIHDTSREAYNGAIAAQFADGALVDNTTSTYAFDILSNGFKPRTSHQGSNYSGQTLIYMAFAENPFKYSNAR